jgi:hypothetical protein
MVVILRDPQADLGAQVREGFGDGSGIFKFVPGNSKANNFLGLISLLPCFSVAL